MSTNAITQKGSVASQQRADIEINYDKLTNEQLHQEMLAARNTLFEKCVETQKYAADVLGPVCEAIIARYKMQGVAAKDRPNSKPTVETYFKSIGLNYNTVRSWIHRKKLQTEMFQTKKARKEGNGKDKIRQLTELEARLLGTASAGHDVVRAMTYGGNVDEAVKEFLEHAPTRERIEEYLERPVAQSADKLRGLAPKRLAMALTAEIACLIEQSGNQERVCICGSGDEAIRYERETDCFAFTVQVLKEDPPASRALVSESANVVEGGTQ